jgi:coniferyl-aldehyde dehydrogenase
MDGHTPKTSDAQRLLELQRAAHRREGPPNARVRIDRLDRLDDMVRKRSESFADAISADFGNRSRFETALLETMVTLSAIRRPQNALVDGAGLSGSRSHLLARLCVDQA